MGIRSRAPNQLERAFAAAFQQYFVGDPSFVRPSSPGTAGAGSMFVAAQSVKTLAFPQVCFLCLEAAEQITGTAIYIGELHIIVDTALNERPDDYDSLLTLHEDRCNKVLFLLGNVSVLKSLTNAPAAGIADTRQVQDFQLYGVGEITKEHNATQANRLSSITSVMIPFQPI